MLEMTRTNERKINALHEQMYHKFQWESDEQRTGNAEFWEDIAKAFDSQAVVFGDCDDYALAMQTELRVLFPDDKDSFYIACVYDENGAGHAVCLCRVVDPITDRAFAYVCDSRFRNPLSWTRLKHYGYKPWCIQEDPSSLKLWDSFQ